LTVKLAMLGCGRVAQHHRKILKSNHVGGFSISACCDPVLEKADDMARSFDATVYTEMEDMLATTDAVAVLVLTPSGDHYEHAKKVLESGRHAIVEKPITLIPEQCRELTEYAAENGLMYGVIFQNRYNPAVQHLKRTLELGRFGKLATATIRIRWCRYQDYYEDEWHGTWKMDGGVINQQAIHHVDALNWLFGPVKTVCATLGRQVNSPEAEDTMIAILRMESGVLSTIEATTAARPDDFEASLSVVGEGGTAVIGGIALNEIHTWTFVEPEAEDALVAEQYSQEVPTGYGLSHRVILQDYIDRLAEGRTDAPVSGTDGVRAVELVHAIYASCETTSWVDLADAPRSQLLGKP
jgi:UDP-N-acetyl-2-amino-2-deoxyglucuronate dehydrogenase